MKKHPLLPERYGDASMQSSMLFALGPYKVTEGDVANPQMKWNLAKAWQDAQALLRHAHWMHQGDDKTPVSEISEYELTADNDDEIERLNVILAGLVACEILDPDSGIGLRQVKHRKGGEMALVISASVADILKSRFPKSRFTSFDPDARALIQ